MEVRRLEGHFNRIWAVCVTPDGNYVGSTSSISEYALLTSRDTTLKVWDLYTGKEVSAFSGDSSFTSVVFSQDNITIIAGDARGKVHFLLFER